MKIGIMTFHWATNYGAVLQAYALQMYLLRLGHDVEIIDYVPGSREKTILGCLKTRHPYNILINICDYMKERQLQAFRVKHLRLSNRYASYRQLEANPPPFDMLVCGSDQIWHYDFTDRGEGKPSYAYFLDFGPPFIKRIAYAASFGCIDYPPNVLSRISPRLKAFDAISVRETSGIQIASKACSKKSIVVPDPTLLLTSADYDKLLESKMVSNESFSFFYILHHNQELIEKIKLVFSSVLRMNVLDSRAFRNSISGLEKWLLQIRNSKAVVTNSFHGIVLAIIFKKPFIAVPVEGRLAEMNDRIYTLLNTLCLEQRIITEYDEHRIRGLLEKEEIDWNLVNQRIESFRFCGQSFLSYFLNSPKERYDLGSETLDHICSAHGSLAGC